MQVEADTRKLSNSDDQHSPPKKKDALLLAIAIFKLAKGVLLLLVGIGALSLIHRDVAETISNLVDAFRVDPNNRHIQALMMKLGLINARKLEEISAGTFFYSALLLTEGTGLLLKKHWAEYFTIIVTSSFIPMEIYELARRLTFPRFMLLGINIGIVIYLVQTIRNRKSAK
ncbi:MAG TPA: DUF2127 domain-containing protein [Blastocatellia bacterium]